MLRPVRLGDVMVGPGYPPLALPDIDMFFNADLAIAEQLVAGVKAAGLNIIKAAIITTPEVAFDKGAEEVYLNNDGVPVSVNYRRLLERKVMSVQQHKRLFQFIRSHDLDLVVSVYDLQGVNMAVEHRCAAIKIASSNVTFQPLIEAVARVGLPIILDTGKSRLEEIERALSWMHRANPASEIIIEHSPYAPPAPVEQQNLNAIPFLRERLGLNVGLSHHARGTLMILGCISLEPAVIEFGLCPDNAGSDQDVYHAVPLSNLAPLVRDIHAVYKALGRPEQFLERKPDFNRGRMSLRAAKDLSAGDTISLQNTAFSFPVLGIPAEHWDDAYGRSLRRPVKCGEPITFDDLA